MELVIIGIIVVLLLIGVFGRHGHYASQGR